MTRIYTSAMAEAYTGLPRSRGDWILLALLVGNDGGGCGVCLPSKPFKSIQ